MLATTATPDRARFTLDGLGTPVVASVMSRPSSVPPRVITLSDPAPSARGEAVRAPGTRKPAWLTALDAWLDPRVDALSRWLTALSAPRT
jgi:hypothetical protein